MKRLPKYICIEENDKFSFVYTDNELKELIEQGAMFDVERLFVIDREMKLTTKTVIEEIK